MSNPLILGTNSIKDTGYNVANSLRFNSGDSPYLSKSISTVSSTKKFTFSTWFKRSKLPTSNVNLFGADGGSTRLSQFFFYEGSGQFIRLFDRLSSTTNIDLTTDMLFRDVSSWYHIVVQVDSTQSTQTNRVKMYINGSQVTFNASATAYTYPSLNADFNFQNASSTSMYVGSSQTSSGTQYGSYDGYMAETVYLDGQSVDQNSFGEFDSDSPNIWKPIDVSGLTFGNNGFYLEYKETGTSANSSGIGADTSGNNNHLTVHNLASTDQTTDTCTNNFATLNPLVGGFSGTFSEGNTRSTLPPTNTSVVSNIAVNNGKWYCEFKYNTIAGYGVLGVAPMDQVIWVNNAAYYYSTGATFGEDGTLFTSGTQSGTTITVSAGNVYGLMWDADNSILKITDGTDTFQRAYTVNDTSIPIGFFFGGSSASVTGDVSVNFGNPPFSISSGNSDANGFGNFEYSVPSGFFSLCTKNLSESG